MDDNGVVHNYYYDGLTAIIERDSLERTENYYVRGLGFGGGIGSIISMTTPKDITAEKVKYKSVYFHYDGLGNVVNISGKNGNQNGKYVYDAFGNILREQGAWSEDNPYRFSTKEHDSTDLVFFGARYYNPQLGRWITKDPAGMVDGPNLYNYVNANPVNLIDEWGEFSLVPQYGIGGMSGLSIPIPFEPTPQININGTSKGNATPTKSAGVKETANNPTMSLKGDKGKDKEKENKGKNTIKRFIDKLKKIKSRTFRNRYTDGKLIYEEDRLHKNELEVYNKRGKHLGAVDAVTGEQIKDIKPGRSIEV
jgi:RHS repeat-associated protein